MISLTASAPGKVILFGEHAVVYGKKAIASSLDLKTNLTLKRNNLDLIELHFPNININKIIKINDLENLFLLHKADSEELQSINNEFVVQIKSFLNLDSENNDTKQLAIVAFLYIYLMLSQNNRNLSSLSIEVTSQLPTGAGLGSSAAYSVCLSSALLHYFDFIKNLDNNSTGYEVGLEKNFICKSIELEKEFYEGSISNIKLQFSQDDLTLINRWAFIAEQIIHGKPSGIDNSVSTFGGAIWYEKGIISKESNMLKLKILLVNTHISRSTKYLIENVRLKHDKFPDIIKPVLDSIEAITTKFSDILKTNTEAESANINFKILEDLIEMNQCHLRFLGVSHPVLEQVLQILKKYNLIGKLTGAGGGGCAFALLSEDLPTDDLNKTITELTSFGFTCYVTLLGASGIEMYQNKNI